LLVLPWRICYGKVQVLSNALGHLVQCPRIGRDLVGVEKAGRNVVVIAQFQICYTEEFVESGEVCTDSWIARVKAQSRKCCIEERTGGIEDEKLRSEPYLECPLCGIDTVQDGG